RSVLASCTAFTGTLTRVLSVRRLICSNGGKLRRQITCVFLPPPMRPGAIRSPTHMRGAWTTLGCTRQHTRHDVVFCSESGRKMRCQRSRCITALRRVFSSRFLVVMFTLKERGRKLGFRPS
ncbi:hypothetical protein B0H11DRAFT_2017322, partial [Mycena galericulata]